MHTRMVLQHAISGLFLLAVVLSMAVTLPVRSMQSPDTNELSPTISQETAAVSIVAPTEQVTPTSPTSLDSITVSNASRLALLARSGRGVIHSVAWSPDGGTLAVAGSIGVWLYAADHLGVDPR